MIPQIYDSADVYIDSRDGLPAKIAAIDAVIDALTSTALKAAGKANIGEYFLDNGQTKIRYTYRNFKEIEASINAFMRIKNIYMKQYNGRVYSMVDRKNFTGSKLI